jgi:signal transduction histidine kinase
MSNAAQVPVNEMDRILSLSELDLDYSNLQNNFKDLTRLAAKVAGTEISLVNLIDSFTQWTVSDFGLPLQQMPREDSVCQYTIVSDAFFEVKDLSSDDRFKDKFYVKGEPKLRYYFGVPLVTEDGYNLGALCVLDKMGKEISPEKVELLKIIASEIVDRFLAIKMIQDLEQKVKEAKDTQRKVAHDIRGPLSGIISLSQIINEMGNNTDVAQIQELVALIHKGGNSLLELADEILGANKKKVGSGQFTLNSFKEKLVKLYFPQALNKQIDFTVSVDPKSEELPVSRNKLLQISGNLISNAIKFTPNNGTVSVYLGLVPINPGYDLHIIISDTGQGLSQSTINDILVGKVSSTEGTDGEQGYGFGLALVRHLIEKLHGRLNISSTPGKGAVFSVVIPQK